MKRSEYKRILEAVGDGALKSTKSLSTFLGAQARAGISGFSIIVDADFLPEAIIYLDNNGWKKLRIFRESGTNIAEIEVFSCLD